MGTFPGPRNAGGGGGGGGVPGPCEVLRGVQFEIGYTSSYWPGECATQAPRDSDDVRTGRFTERTGDGLESPRRRLSTERKIAGEDARW